MTTFERLFGAEPARKGGCHRAGFENRLFTDKTTCTKAVFATVNLSPGDPAIAARLP